VNGDPKTSCRQKGGMSRGESQALRDQLSGARQPKAGLTGTSSWLVLRLRIVYMLLAERKALNFFS